jgi:MinD-like ATPase involved in chromosome partitioning or flagellar assembly
MGIVAISGDLATTTTVVLAASWPAASDAILVEADPSGGDVAAWFDLPASPSLSTVVARVHDGAWPDIERHTRLAENGLRVLPAPARAIEAARAVGEAGRAIVPTLAALRAPVAITDVGRATPAGHPFVEAASVHVIVHRQSHQSAGAAAVRLQRLAEHVDERSSLPVVVVVVGSSPFGLGEIEALLVSTAGRLPVVSLPDDPLAACVLAGRTGVSGRRLARLPLMRAGRELATAVDHALTASVDRHRRVVR